MSLKWPSELVQQRELSEYPQYVIAEMAAMPDEAVENVLARLHLQLCCSLVYLKPTCYKMLCLLQSADKTWPTNDSSYLEGVEKLQNFLRNPAPNLLNLVDHAVSTQMERLICYKIWPLIWCLRTNLTCKDQIIPATFQSDPLSSSAFFDPPKNETGTSLGSSRKILANIAKQATSSVKFDVARRRSEATALARSGAYLLYWNEEDAIWHVRTSLSNEHFEEALQLQKCPPLLYILHHTTCPPLKIDSQYLLLHKLMDLNGELWKEVPATLLSCGSCYVSMPTSYRDFTNVIRVSTRLDENQFKANLSREMKKAPLCQLMSTQEAEHLHLLIQFRDARREDGEEQGALLM